MPSKDNRAMKEDHRPLAVAFMPLETRREAILHLARVCPVIPAVVAEDPEESRRGAAWFVAFYLTSMGPFYPAALKRQGFVKEVDAVLAANTTRGSAVVPPEADALLEQLTVFGTPQAARARLARWVECGADLPIVMLRPNLSNEQITFELRALRSHAPSQNCSSPEDSPSPIEQAAVVQEPASSRLPTNRPTPLAAHAQHHWVS